MKRVVIESPLAGDFDRNIRYAQFAALDCLERGEAPYASHLFFPQFLVDADPQEREQGIVAGLEWGRSAELVAIYVDLGVSEGMRRGIAAALERGTPYESRMLSKSLWECFGLNSRPMQLTRNECSHEGTIERLTTCESSAEYQWCYRCGAIREWPNEKRPYGPWFSPGRSTPVDWSISTTAVLTREEKIAFYGANRIPYCKYCGEQVEREGMVHAGGCGSVG